MSKKNENYAPLLALGLSPSELERAKARIRSRKAGLVSAGLNEDQASLAAIQFEVERHSSPIDDRPIPAPPEGSGLEVRGSKYPKPGVSNPLHWSFTYYDASEAKKVRFPYDKIPPRIAKLFPEGLDETIELKRRIEEEQGGIQARIERIEAWIEQNKEHRNLQSSFIERENTARRERNRKYTKGIEPTALRVISEYFLNPTSNHFLPDVRHWSYYYNDFLSYLKGLRNLRSSNRGAQLSKNTQKNYIGCLNRYVAYVWEKGQFTGKPAVCPNYPRSELPRRGVESIISAEEENAFEKHFTHRNLPVVASFIRVANHIAGRPSEVLGITMADVFPGDNIDDPNSETMVALKTSLNFIAKKNGLTVHGFVRIRGQIGVESRQEDGSLHYYPSKTVKEVDPANYRYCPVVDSKVWNKLMDLIDIASANDHFGDDPSTTLLFEGLSLSDLQEYFREFRKGTSWEELDHTPHCCRHTGCTRWVAWSKGDLEAAQKILGHKSFEETQGYSHLLELYHQELEQTRVRNLGKSEFVKQFKRV